MQLRMDREEGQRGMWMLDSVRSRMECPVVSRAVERNVDVYDGVRGGNLRSLVLYFVLVAISHPNENKTKRKTREKSC